MTFYYEPSYCKDSKKFIRADLEILACITFGQIGPKIYLLPHRRGIFFVNFTYVTFVFLSCPIMLQSFRKFVRVNPEIMACVIFGQNCPQNYPFAPKKDFFETFTYVTFVYLLSSITMQRFKKSR